MNSKIQECVEWLDSNYPTIDSRNERYIKKKSEVWYDWIIEYSSFLGSNATFRDRLATVVLGIKEQPKCKTCDADIYGLSGIKWKTFCCNLCAISHGRKVLREDCYVNQDWRDNQAAVVAKGVFDKYGVYNPMSIEGMADKIRASNQDIYGADYHTMTKSGADKISSGLGIFFKSPAGDAMRDSRKQIMLNEYQRASECDDTTVYDKGKVGGKSKTEIAFKSMVEDIVGYALYSKYIKTLMGNREIDIFLPEFNLGIEFNGCYSHSVEGGKSAGYHLDKQIGAEDAGITLITVWEDDYLNRDKLKIILDRIRVMVGKPTIKYQARKCQLTNVTIKEYKQFLQSYHIQGQIDHSSVRLGLEYDGVLVSVMGFKRCPNNVKKYGDSTNVWELCRFASSGHVVGAFSRLLKLFTSIKSPKLVYSFGDRMIVKRHDNVYTKNGFHEHSISNPDYMYLYKSKRAHKFNFRKSRFLDLGFIIEGKTENELRVEAKLPIIYDAGKICYVMEL
jgi:hypothetical protein